MKYPTKYLPRRIGLYTQAIVKPVFKARGLLEGKIITHWSQIVGDRYASLSLPEKITFPKGKRGEGTLYLSVSSASSLFIHYSQGVILEHINRFFGYKAVAKLHMSHGFKSPKVEVQKVLSPLSQDEKDWLEEQLHGVKDPELKIYLKKLGESICGG